MNFYNSFDFVLDKNMGLVDANYVLFSAYISSILKNLDSSVLIVTKDIIEAQKIYSDMYSFNNNTYLFLMDDFLTSEAVTISPDLQINRLETLSHIYDSKNSIVICNLMSYLRFLPLPTMYRKSIVTISVNDEISPKKLVDKLVNIGYVIDDVVNKTGDIGVRGFVVDVFSLLSDLPVRIEFFGDTVESIRYFDVDSQRSLKSVDSVCIYPNSEFLTDKNLESNIVNNQKFYPCYEDACNISSYFNKLYTFFVNYNEIVIENNKLNSEIDDYRLSRDIDFKSNYMFDLEYILKSVKFPIYYFSFVNVPSLNFELSSLYSFKCCNIIQFNEDIDGINKFIRDSLIDKKIVSICLKKYQLDKIKKIIKFNCIYTSIDNLFEDSVNLIDLDISCGFEYNNYVFICSNELFKNYSKSHKYSSNFRYYSPILDINKFNIGDYVVHNIYGIGIYNGIVSLKYMDNLRDYVEVLYKNNDKIYIPINSINLLSKYSGRDGVEPKINGLNSSEWQKTKQRIRKKVHDVADKLIKLYAERASKHGFAFSPDNEKMKLFQDAFDYDLTVDQIKSINDIKRDMESSLPMDRLLCGDVGFGKTEVAFVAAYKAILDYKQVLFLCPTTILSSQHYENALKRFLGFDVEIALLNRFTSKKETDRIIEEFSYGKINLLIGTHRLLSSDVVACDLGLVIIDEEQRFGVRHKERLKEIKSSVDVLTLSATPIPRTLQMSLVGIRSLSLIETAPVNRLPVETYVLEENPQIIKNAIEKEIARFGQVYILYNRVESIDSYAYYISTIVPDARIAVAHGRMDKSRLESTINDFVDYKYDILVCTTIIEIGMDISRVNTLIVIDSDRFGLSQLYQLRGRVGRSEKFAFAYFMYRPSKILTETSKARLEAISNFTRLGSGFAIASRDLSIRGAGDILGFEQAGFFDSVGIDLYLKILNDEIKNINDNIDNDNSIVEEDVIYNKPLINVSNHISDSYVESEDLKIEIHKLISSINSIDKLNIVKEEINDRFGAIPDSLDIYMYEELFEVIALKYDIKNTIQTKSTIEIILSEKILNILDMSYLFNLSYRISKNFTLKNVFGNIRLILFVNNLDKHPIYYLVELFNEIDKNINDKIENI